MNKLSQTGFTLVEMIVVMVITGIIGGMVAIFIKAPVQGYVDSARRAELTDIADTALRRIARDVRTAVPNSVRVVATSLVNVTSNSCTATAVMPCFLEFIPTKDGGRYRADTGGTNNVLKFGEPDDSFEIIGSAIDFTAGAAPDYIVIGSTQSNAVPPYNTSITGVLRQYTGATGAQTTVIFSNTALPVWAELPTQRFDVVDGAQQAVTYSCENVNTLDGNGTGQLRRYSKYGFTHILSGTPPILADRVSACSMEYGVVNQRLGLLTVRLTLSSGGESISLYQTIHVNNAP